MGQDANCCANSDKVVRKAGKITYGENKKRHMDAK